MQNVDAGLVIGTRPSFIMAAPIIHAIDQADINLHVIHTGQHYSDNMDSVFFADLGLRRPDTRLASSEGGTPARQLADILIGAETWVINTRPKVVMVLGDTNSNFAAAVAARKQGTPIWHIEAGERSHNIASTEEQNRVMIDHISSLHLCTNEKSRGNLLNEGLSDENIRIVGNPIVDTLVKNLKKAENYHFDDLIIRNTIAQPYWLMTLHRQESVDNRETLSSILHNIARQARIHGRKIIFPVHPRTMVNIKKFNIENIIFNVDEFLVLPGLRYIQFISLLSNSELCITDSGGVQQESAITSIPTVTVMESTPWPETVEMGINVLVSPGSKDWSTPFKSALTAKRHDGIWKGFGNGNTGQLIAELLREHILVD